MKYIVALTIAVASTVAVAAGTGDGSVCGSGASITQTLAPKDKSLPNIVRCNEESASSPASSWFMVGESSVHYSRVSTGEAKADDWIAFITAVNQACIHRNGEKYGDCYDNYVSAYEDQEHKA